MAVTKVQSATGNGSTIVLNGCAAGNALTYQNSWFRSVATGVNEAAPADSNGTFTFTTGDFSNYGGGQDTGVTICHQQNIASGTHTVTPETGLADFQKTLTEYSGLATTGMFVAGSSAHAGTVDVFGNTVSQVTGTTSTAASTGDLSIISFARAASPGNANIGLTDPVSTYTTLMLGNNDSSTMAHQHAFKVLGAGGTQSATFNWTEHVGEDIHAHAAIATFVAAGGGHTVTVNQASETDTAQPISRLKTKAIGQNSETDLSQAITKRKQKTLGQSSETDLAQPINRNKLKILGQTTETDLSQPITRVGAKLVAVNQVSETDLAQPINRLKTKLLGQAAETDLAQAIAKLKFKTLGQPSEIDLSQPIHWKVQRLVNQVSEIDLARPIAAIKTGGSVTASPYFYDLTGAI